MGVFIFLVISIFSSVTAQLLLKKGVSLLSNVDFSFFGFLDLIFQFLKNVYLLFGMSFFIIAFISWIFVLSKKNLGVVYPISSSLTLSMIVLGSYIIFRESISFYQIFGIFFIICGIFLLLFKG